MHFYWRIMEELRFLGETMVFRDPGLSRAYKAWLEKNAVALSMGERVDRPRMSSMLYSLGMPYSLN